MLPDLGLTMDVTDHLRELLSTTAPAGTLVCRRVMFSRILRIFCGSCTPSWGFGLLSRMNESRCLPRDEDVKGWRQKGQFRSLRMEGFEEEEFASCGTSEFVAAASLPRSGVLLLLDMIAHVLIVPMVRVASCGSESRSARHGLMQKTDGSGWS